MSKFTTMLKHVRLQRKMSKADVARELGWTPMYYGRYENGYLNPTKANINMFAVFLNINESELENIIKTSSEGEKH